MSSKMTVLRSRIAGDLRLAPALAAPLADRRERRDVVEAQVVGVVLVAVERDAELAEDGLVREQVQRLGVGEHAVEVEDDGADVGHQRIRSPAGIGTFRRFSRGGTGHSYSGLKTQYGW